MGKLILNGIPYGNSEGKRGIAPYKETILYDATDVTFKNITLSDSLLNYDAIIFHVHDTAYAGTNNAQQSGGYIYSRQDILGCMSSALKQIWLAGYGNTYATYTLTDETHLTANTNVTSVCNRIIGIKYGKCDTQYIQGAEFYSKDEEQIGVWIDKKPLYRKVYDFSSSPLNIPNNTWLKINNESGIQPIYGRGIITNSTAALELAIDVDADGIYVRSYFTYSACDYIIIEYTKDSDTPGNGGYQAYGFSPIIYSKEEREVGVWVDNKPLYAKTYDIPSITISSAGTAIPNIDISVVDTFVNGYGVSQEYGQVSPLALYNYNGLNAASNINISVDKIVMYYTKTTDVPGSGKYNTLGVSNVHYKDDWHVVGTWWNGKPIYEKTFHFTTADLPADRATIEKIYNFDELVGIDGYFGYQFYSNDYRNFRLGETPPQLSNKAIYLLCEGNDQVNDIQDLDFNFNGLDRSKIVYISATVRYTKTTD